MARCVSDACYAEQLQMLCNERLPRRGTDSPCSGQRRTFLPALLMHMIMSAFLFFTSVMTKIRSQVFEMMKPNLSLGRSDSGLSIERARLRGLGSSTAVWVSPFVAMVSLQTSKAGDS
ncbi:uncharacterized [Tachysurus ichikawai]